MTFKPETIQRKRLKALERHRALLDAFTAFVKSHPHLAEGACLKLLYGKVGLSFYDYALIVPYWLDGKPAMKLLKSGADWINQMSTDDYINMNRIVSEDVSKMSDRALGKLLDKMYEEANPDEDE